MNLREKVRGCFLGVAIGDALGKSVEYWTSKQIKEKFGRITSYVVNPDHKYFDGKEPGYWTDDTQLTLAMSRAICRSNDLDMKAIAEEHALEFMQSIIGWGRNTINAVSNYINNMPPGINIACVMKDDRNAGRGNGNAMKFSPAGFLIRHGSKEIFADLIRAGLVTHGHYLGVVGGLLQAKSIDYCLTAPEFKKKDFIKNLMSCRDLMKQSKNIYAKMLLGKIDMGDAVAHIEFTLADGTKFSPTQEFIRDKEERRNFWLSIMSLSKDRTDEEIIADFKGGRAYVPHSLPTAYAFFLRKPDSVEAVFDCVAAGGDTDTNASLVGALLGTLYGESFWSDELVEGLQHREKILKVADEFYEMLVLREQKAISGV